MKIDLTEIAKLKALIEELRLAYRDLEALRHAHRDLNA